MTVMIDYDKNDRVEKYICFVLRMLIDMYTLGA